METSYIVAAACALPLFLVAYALLRCKHPWELVDKTELPAPMETLVRCGVSTAWLGTFQIERMCRKKLILAMRCPKCGIARIYEKS